MTFRQIVTRGFAFGALGTTSLLGFSSLKNGDAPPELVETTTILPVELAPVEAVSSFMQLRTFTGVLKASRTSELGFERTGRLIEIVVQEGDRLESGQVLAHLDDQNLQAKRRELSARRAAAQSLLEEFEAGPRVQTIAAARADVEDLKSQVELAGLNFGRREELLDARAISQEDYDRTALGLKSVTAKLAAAQNRLDELEAGTRSETIDSQRAMVDQLDAALADVDVDIAESTLVAPFSGVVGKRYLDEGTIVAPGAAILRIVEDQELEAWIGLPVHIARGIRGGQQVTLFIERVEQAATFKVVLPELDPATRTRTAIFRLETPTPSYPGQVVRIELEDRAEAEGFWLPTTALARGNRGLWSVLVAEQRGAGEQLVAAKRDVEVLYTDGEQVLVRGTVETTDRVILTGTHRIVAGQEVMAQRPQPRSHY